MVESPLNYTIFIPTFRRPQYLTRILGYFQQFNRPYHIVVADSSPPDDQALNKDVIARFPSLTISHLTSYPPDLNPHKKFADMVFHTQDPYCIFCADDDFINPYGVEAAVQFLEQHPDFSCAHGNYIAFRYLPQKQRFLWQPIYPYVSLTSNEPQDRFRQHFVDYYQVLYSVRRTKLVQTIYQEFLRSDTDPMQFGELLPDLLTVIYSKMQRLNVFYGARQIESRVAYWPTLFEYMDQGVYEPAYETFKACLSLHLGQMTGMTTHQAQVFVDDTMNQYLAKQRKKESIGSLSINMKKLHVPPVIFQLFREVYGKIARPDDYISWTTRDPPLKNLDAFNRIKNAVIQSSL